MATRAEANKAAGRNSMFVVNLMKKYKKEGFTHDIAHWMALERLRQKRVIEGKNTRYVDDAIERCKMWISPR